MSAAAAAAGDILVAGIGNIFLGDDAFGVEVVHRLARRGLPAGVRLVDFGIRGFDLAQALLEEGTTAILVDATPRGGAPGTLYLLEVGPPGETEGHREGEGEGEAGLEPHGLDPAAVLHLVRQMGGRPQRVLVVGCEPAGVDWDEDGEMGLSPAVEQALPEAVRLVETTVARLLAGSLPPATGTGTDAHADAQEQEQEQEQEEAV